MAKTQKATTAVGYTRVSTSEQALGDSLESQLEKIKAMACVQDAEVVEIISDAGESAKSLARPGMARLLAMVDAGKVQVVIVAKLARLTRSVKDLGELLERFKKHNVALVSVAESLDTGSAAGRLVMNLLCSVSQWEREEIGERTATVLQHKKKHRKVYSATPYGLTRDGDMLVLCPQEQAVVGRVKAHRADGWSLQRIADALNGDGVPTKHGSRWFPQTVKDVLTNTLNSEAAA